MTARKRNRLTPWFIGMTIIFLAELYVIWDMFFCGCPGQMIPKILVVAGIPGVYLTLMYLTLTSQE